MIILTAQQADAVRGPTSNQAALMPVKLVGGAYVLPEEVLSDPNHKVHYDFLSPLPKREVLPSEWPPADGA